MEVSSVSQRSYLVEFNRTETNFLNELAASADCKVEKIIADLTFQALVDSHAQMRINEMMKEHKHYWEH